MSYLCSLIVLVSLGANPAGQQTPIALPPATDDFRIENIVFGADQKEPPCESTTIFCGGVVYDCMKTPAETIIFDATAGRFVLLNVNRRTRTELATSELAAFSDRLQHMAMKSSDPLVKFLAAPKFDVRYDRVGNELALGSPWVNYKISTLSENQTAAEQYREFSDWYAKLNALLSPGSRPPFGRVAVDAELAQRNLIASEVALTLSSLKSNHHRSTIRSQHRLVRPLEGADLDRVADARQQMERFKAISFEEYRKSELR